MHSPPATPAAARRRSALEECSASTSRGTHPSRGGAGTQPPEADQEGGTCRDDANMTGQDHSAADRKRLPQTRLDIAVAPTRARGSNSAKGSRQSASGGGAHSCATHSSAGPAPALDAGGQKNDEQKLAAYGRRSYLGPGLEKVRCSASEFRHLVKIPIWEVQENCPLAGFGGRLARCSPPNTVLNGFAPPSGSPAPST